MLQMCIFGQAADRVDLIPEKSSLQPNGAEWEVVDFNHTYSPIFTGMVGQYMPCNNVSKLHTLYYVNWRLGRSCLDLDPLF